MLPSNGTSSQLLCLPDDDMTEGTMAFFGGKACSVINLHSDCASLSERSRPLCGIVS